MKNYFMLMLLGINFSLHAMHEYPLHEEVKTIAACMIKYEQRCKKETDDMSMSFAGRQIADFQNHLQETKSARKNCLKELPTPDEIDSIQITKLDLSKNRISRLPRGIKQFGHLKELNISHNQLQELPPELGSLKTLTKFCASHNKIRKLSKCFTGLTCLLTLDLSDNELTELPSGISALNSLENLNVSHNKLTQLPEILSSLKLKELDVSHNEMQRKPAVIKVLIKNSVKLNTQGNPYDKARLQNYAKTEFSRTNKPRKIYSSKKPNRSPNNLAGYIERPKKIISLPGKPRSNVKNNRSKKEIISSTDTSSSYEENALKKYQESLSKYQLKELEKILSVMEFD